VESLRHPVRYRVVATLLAKSFSNPTARSPNLSLMWVAMTMTARSMAQKSFERRRTQAPTISQVRNNLPLALFPSCALDVFEHSLKSCAAGVDANPRIDAAIGVSCGDCREINGAANCFSTSRWCPSRNCFLEGCNHVDGGTCVV
jgi:hypothetical protein